MKPSATDHVDGLDRAAFGERCPEPSRGIPCIRESPLPPSLHDLGSKASDCAKGFLDVPRPTAAVSGKAKGCTDRATVVGRLSSLALVLALSVGVHKMPPSENGQNGRK